MSSLITHMKRLRKKLVILTLNVKYKTCVLLVSQITSEYQKAATIEHFDMKKLNRSNTKV